MNKFKEKSNLIIIFSLLIFGDQLSKQLIRQSGGFFVCNTGIAWGIQLPFWAIILAVVIILLFLSSYYFRKLIKSKDKILVNSLLLILAGATSNLIDRFRFGCVIDFIDVSFFNYPLFNFADAFIVIGAIIMAYQFLINKKYV